MSVVSGLVSSLAIVDVRTLSLGIMALFSTSWKAAVSSISVFLSQNP